MNTPVLMTLTSVLMGAYALVQFLSSTDGIGTRDPQMAWFSGCVLVFCILNIADLCYAQNDDPLDDKDES